MASISAISSRSLLMTKGMEGLTAAMRVWDGERGGCSACSGPHPSASSEAQPAVRGTDSGQGTPLHRGPP